MAPAVVIMLGLGRQPWPSTMGVPAAVINAGLGAMVTRLRQLAEGLLKPLTLLVVVPAIVVNAGGGGGCRGR